MGIQSTIKRLLSSGFYWKFMRQHVQYFLKHCSLCQKLNVNKFPTHAHPFTTSTYAPMQCLNIDFVGPFPDKGFILTIIDTFTRWVELYHTTDNTAASAAKCLLQHFGRFGAPAQIRSDNGTHFTADVIAQFLALVGVQHFSTLPYNSQDNALVERANKEINRHIRALTYENNTLEDYVDSLPFVQRILNSGYSDRLKVSAAELLFGKMIDLNAGLFISRKERNNEHSSETVSSYMVKLLAMQDSLIMAAKANSILLDNLHLESNSIPAHEFEVNSFVLVRYRSGAPPTRLHTIWQGPMRVIRSQNSEYTLLDLVRNKEYRFHASNMKPFVFDPLLVNPQDVARHDYLEFFVEKILAHKGNFRRKASLEFQVKWVGYDDSRNTWEPYSALRDLKPLHEYLSETNLKSLIPTKFR